VVWLVVVWVFLWGRISVANVLSGVLVAVALQVVVPVPRVSQGRLVMRPLAVAQLVGYFAYKLVQANLSLARAVLFSPSRPRSGVVEVPLVGASDALLTLVANMSALVPGTIPVEVSEDPPTIYVHVLQLDDVEAVRREMRTLERLAIRAFGSPDAGDARPREEAR